MIYANSTAGVAVIAHKISQPRDLRRMGSGLPHGLAAVWWQVATTNTIQSPAGTKYSHVQYL